MTTLVSFTQGKPVSFPSTKKRKHLALQGKPWIQIGKGLGMGLVYINHYGLVWMHAGGMPGYQSMYSYNPSNNMIVALCYSKQPRKAFHFYENCGKYL